MSVPVKIAGPFLPDVPRQSFELATTMTLEEVVLRAFPRLTDEARAGLRVVLVRGGSMAVIAPRHWRFVRPHPGTQVVIRIVPEGGAGFLIAALASYQVAPIIGLNLFLGSALSSATITALTIGIGLGLTYIGGTLLNALVPVYEPPSGPDTAQERYNIQGWRNRARPGEAVPYVSGRIRMAPDFAARGYTEVVGKDQYVRALFCFGYGPLNLSDLRIGSTPIEEFSDVEIEIREGRPEDDPITIYPRQVIEDGQQVLLSRPYPVDSAGNIIAGSVAEETPHIVRTATNATRVSAVFSFPSGLVRFTEDGDDKYYTRRVRIEEKPEEADDSAWSLVREIDFTERETQAFFRQVSWSLPSRGRWDIRFTMLTDDSTNARYYDDVYLASLQSVRPEHPINTNVPLTLVAIRIRATHQLNGTLEDFNALTERYQQDWTGAGWAEGLTRNPAAHLVDVLQSRANAYPAGTDEINWGEIEEFHDFCAAQGFTYDRVHTATEPLSDVLAAICQAGRATWRHDGTRWGVVIDRAQPLVTAHFTPQNARDFVWSRGYFEPPDALVARFLDETNDYEADTYVLPWNGQEIEVNVTEELALPGQTNPDAVARALSAHAGAATPRRHLFAHPGRRGTAGHTRRHRAGLASHSDRPAIQRPRARAARRRGCAGRTGAHRGGAGLWHTLRAI